MIKVNNNLIEQEQFGDCTLKCKTPPLYATSGKIKHEILWCYDNDAELFTIICIVDHLRNHYPNEDITLYMPYIPHARQDREISGRLFTLKSFAKIINSLNFSKVSVCDPHSDVSLALFDRLQVITPFLISYDEYAVMYPDAGAAKKYSPKEGVSSPIIGNKHRDEDGRIVSYELLNFPEGTKKVIIRDDICSYGGTFVAAAKELRQRGVDKIVLCVTHCENNILKGDVFNYIDMVFTTDSICTIEHPKLTIGKSFRDIIK